MKTKEQLENALESVKILQENIEHIEKKIKRLKEAKKSQQKTMRDFLKTQVIKRSLH